MKRDPFRSQPADVLNVLIDPTGLSSAQAKGITFQSSSSWNLESGQAREKGGSISLREQETGQLVQLSPSQ
jgi:hypothetical protein